jgi:hypothetical protein
VEERSDGEPVAIRSSRTLAHRRVIPGKDEHREPIPISFGDPWQDLEPGRQEDDTCKRVMSDRPAMVPARGF